jgi:hypothetical protein
MRANPFDFPFDLAQGFVLRPQAKTWQACGNEEETFIFRTAAG